MEQKPKVRLPRAVHIATLEKRNDMRAWHMSWVDVNAPSKEIAIEAAIKPASHWGSSRRGDAVPDSIFYAKGQKRVDAVSFKPRRTPAIYPPRSFDKRDKRKRMMSKPAGATEQMGVRRETPGAWGEV